MSITSGSCCSPMVLGPRIDAGGVGGSDVRRLAALPFDADVGRGAAFVRACQSMYADEESSETCLAREYVADELNDEMDDRRSETHDSISDETSDARERLLKTKSVRTV